MLERFTTGDARVELEQVSSAPHIPSRAAQERILECMLLIVCIGLAALLHVVVGYKMVVLNLFFLPVVLAAFFLGRMRAGTLALFCVLLATVIAVWDLPAFAADTTPLIIGLSLTVWAAVMGLNAIIVGTLSDERAGKMAELHDANLGIVEVMAQYLVSADHELNDRSQRVATLSQSLAHQLHLSTEEVADIRVAALLRDLHNIEVTAEVIQRAYGELGPETMDASHTFHGRDLVQSLERILINALPLLMSRPSGLEFDELSETERDLELPLGAAIIEAAHRFDSLVYDDHEPFPRHEALDLMESELDGDFHPAVLAALRKVMLNLPERAVERLDSLEELVVVESDRG